MTFADGAVALADEHLTTEFFQKNGVRLSVEAVAATGIRPGRNPTDPGPNFFYWTANGAVFLVDFGDGFSQPLHDSIDAALAIVRASGVSLDAKQVFWRSAAKQWHRHEHPSDRSTTASAAARSAIFAMEGC